MKTKSKRSIVDRCRLNKLLDEWKTAANDFQRQARKANDKVFALQGKIKILEARLDEYRLSESEQLESIRHISEMHQCLHKTIEYESNKRCQEFIGKKRALLFWAVSALRREQPRKVMHQIANQLEGLLL